MALEVMVEGTRIRPRAEFTQAILDHLLENEWPMAQETCGRGCHTDWVNKCPSCGAKEWGGKGLRGHNPDCKAASLIQESEAFLQGEEEPWLISSI